MENNNDIAIEVKNLAVSYSGREILKDINFKVRRGAIFVVVGGSSSGKSTLMRQMIGIEKPDSGQVIIEGEDFTAADREKVKEIQQKFSVMFQSSGLFASMTLAENMALLLKKSTDLSEQRMMEVIEMKLKSVGIGGYEDFLPEEISGGMKKRAGIARAMTLDPDIIFFDEPSSGLDPVTAASIDGLIRELNKGLGTTMVVVSHDLQSILQIADTIIMLDKETKTIIAQGTPDELKNMEENEYVYKFFNRLPA